MSPWAGHAQHPTLTDIMTVAQSSWLCSRGLIPLGWTLAGLAGPGCPGQGRAGQGRASRGKTTEGFRCQFPPEQELPEPRVTQALPHSGYSSLTALRWPCTPSDHKPSLSPRPPDVWYSRQPQPKHAGLPPPEGARVYTSLRVLEKGTQSSHLGQGLLGRCTKVLFLA